MRDQKNILKKSKNFLKEASFNNLDIAYNPNYFLSSWSESIGYLNIKNFFNKKIPIFFKNKIIFKEFFSINKDFLIKEKNLIDFDYTDLVITYFFPENLKKDGTYDDKYFSTNSKSIKKVLWILIPLSKNIKNRKTKKNVIILKRKNNNIFKNLFFTLLMFFQSFVMSYGFRNIEKIKFKNTSFSESLSNIILDLIKNRKIKKIFFPYEAQPHQHFFTNKIKKENNKIRIIGYMHTVIPPLPLDYIKRDGHPDKVLVNGIAQKNILCEKLGWSKKEIKNINSLRYKKKINYNFENKILLPYFLESEHKVFKYFKKLISLKKNKFFTKLKIKNHPAMKNSKKHLNLEHNLKNYINRNHRNFKNLNSKTKICICIGSTASVIEALERNYKVFHICCDPDLEKFQSYYWDKIKIYSYSNNIFEYKLKDKGKLIKLNNSKRTNFVTKY